MPQNIIWKSYYSSFFFTGSTGNPRCYKHADLCRSCTFTLSSLWKMCRATTNPVEVGAFLKDVCVCPSNMAYGGEGWQHPAIKGSREGVKLPDTFSDTLSLCGCKQKMAFPELSVLPHTPSPPFSVCLLSFFFLVCADCDELDGTAGGFGRDGRWLDECLCPVYMWGHPWNTNLIRTVTDFRLCSSYSVKQRAACPLIWDVDLLDTMESSKVS